MLRLDADGNEAFERSPDLSKLPNPHEVYFRLGWMSEGLPWIPPALATVEPVTSSTLVRSPTQYAAGWLTWALTTNSKITDTSHPPTTTLLSLSVSPLPRLRLLLTPLESPLINFFEFVSYHGLYGTDCNVHYFASSCRSPSCSPFSFTTAGLLNVRLPSERYDLSPLPPSIIHILSYQSPRPMLTRLRVFSLSFYIHHSSLFLVVESSRLILRETSLAVVVESYMLCSKNGMRLRDTDGIGQIMRIEGKVFHQPSGRLRE